MRAAALFMSGKASSLQDAATMEGVPDRRNVYYYVKKMRAADPDGCVLYTQQSESKENDEPANDVVNTLGVGDIQYHTCGGTFEQYTAAVRHASRLNMSERLASEQVQKEFGITVGRTAINWQRKNPTKDIPRKGSESLVPDAVNRTLQWRTTLPCCFVQVCPSTR